MSDLTDYKRLVSEPEAKARNAEVTRLKAELETARAETAVVVGALETIKKYLPDSIPPEIGDRSNHQLWCEVNHLVAVDIPEIIDSALANISDSAQALLRDKARIDELIAFMDSSESCQMVFSRRKRTAWAPYRIHTSAGRARLDAGGKDLREVWDAAMGESK